MPIVHKVYKFYLIIYNQTKLFPKKDQHTIGQKLDLLILDILELILLANPKTIASKLLILDKVDIKLKILKFYIRLCFDTKIIDLKKYLLWQDSIQEIGRMLGGWIRDIKAKPRQYERGETSSKTNA